jgi:hypothetical protein
MIKVRCKTLEGIMAMLTRLEGRPEAETVLWFRDIEGYPGELIRVKHQDRWYVRYDTCRATWHPVTTKNLAKRLFFALPGVYCDQKRRTR